MKLWSIVFQDFYLFANLINYWKNYFLCFSDYTSNWRILLLLKSISLI